MNSPAVDPPPSHTMVHSNDFNRYITPFRCEGVVVVGVVVVGVVVVTLHRLGVRGLVLLLVVLA